MLSLGRICQGAAGQLLLGNHDLCLSRNITDGEVLDRDIGIAVLMELFPQRSSTEGAGAHACITGVSDEVQLFAADLLFLALALSLHGLHISLGTLQGILFLVVLGHLDKGGSHHEGNNRSYNNIGNVSQESSFRSHGENSDNGTRGSGGNEAAAQHVHGEDTAHAAGDNCQYQLGLHEDIGEVDLMDTAQEVDDHGTRGRSLGHAFAHEPVSQEHTETRTGVSLDKEEHGLAKFLSLLDAQGAEDAVIDGVVQEQDLGGLHQDGNQRQQTQVHNALNAGAENVVHRQHHRADTHEGQHCQHAAQDTGGEVVHQHLEAAGNGILHSPVKLLDKITAQGAHNHGAQEHGDICTGDDTAGGDGANHAAAMPIDCGSTREAQEQRNQPLGHGAAHLSQILIGEPARRNE